MKAFSLLIYIALIGCTFSLPQPWFFSSAVEDAAEIADKGLELGNSAVETASKIESNTIQTSTDLAKTALSKGIEIKSNSLQGATNTIEKGLDAAGSTMSSIPFIGSPMSYITSLGKLGVDTANNVEQAVLRATDSVGQAGLSALNGATLLKMNTIVSLANTGTALGQQLIKMGANYIEEGLKNGLFTNHMQQEIGKLINGLTKSANNVKAELNEIGVIKDRLENVVNELASLIESDSVKQIQENVDVTKKKLEDIRNEIETLIERNKGKPIGESMKEMSANIGHILGELGSVVAGNTGEQAMSDVGDHFAKAMDEVGAVINDNPLEGITNTVAEITDQLENVVSDLGSTIEQENRPVGEIIDSVGDKIGNAMSKVGSTVAGEKGERILGNLGERVSKVMSEVGSTVGSVQKINSVANSLKGQVGQAVGLVKSFVNNTNREDIIHLLTNGPIASIARQFGGGGGNAPAEESTPQSVPDKIGCTLGKTLVGIVTPMVLG